MEIVKIVSKICETKENVKLREYCTIRIGGVGKIACFPKNISELKKLVKFLNKKQIRYFVVGNGSNIIFEDGGVDFVLIFLKKMCRYNIKGNTITCESGLNLFALNYICAENSLGGLEWSYGIPASVGGAVAMNAGAYGGEIKDYIKYVWVLNGKKIIKYSASEMGFGYRKSNILQSDNIIVKATFVLEYGEKEKIKEMQKMIFEKRLSTQPYNFFSAGSVFKKMNNESAGKTIDKLGLKSVKIGNIQISDIHANFFVNLGDGKSSDMHSLIEFTKSRVYDETGSILQEEVIFVGNKRK